MFGSKHNQNQNCRHLNTWLLIRWEERESKSARCPRNFRVSIWLRGHCGRPSEKLGSHEEELGGEGKDSNFDARNLGVAPLKGNHREGAERAAVPHGPRENAEGGSHPPTGY